MDVITLDLCLKQELNPSIFDETAVKQERSDVDQQEPIEQYNLDVNIHEFNDDYYPPVPVKNERVSDDDELESENFNEEQEYIASFRCKEEQKHPESLPTDDFSLETPNRVINPIGIKDSKLTCRVCKKYFATLVKLDIHKREPAFMKTFACCACGKTFRDMTQLNVHVRKHTGDKPYSCKICNKPFSINGNLNKHMRTHTGERKYECDTCSRKFTQFAHLEDHMKTHSLDRPFICHHCDSSFKTKARLRKHIKSHDQLVKKKNIYCAICFKTFWSAKQLSIHLSRHSDSENPFKCIECEKEFKEYPYLQAHLKTHQGLRAYKCQICGKAFASSSHLRRHLNAHSGVKPFVCDICMRGFPSSQNLKRHIKTHTGEKPYACETCQKAFLTLENLNRHMRIHTGEKPFTCPTCDKKFAHSTSVKEHLRIHTGEKPYGCSICDKRFGMNKLLYKHIRTRHPQHANIINSMKSGDYVPPIQFVQVKTEKIDDNYE